MHFLDKIICGKATLSDQERALKDPELAYLFARYIEGADIERCQEAACKDLYWAYKFARFIPEANIEKCQEAACKDTEEAFLFARWVPGADIGKSIEVCRGSEWEGLLNTYLMEKALL